MFKKQPELGRERDVADFCQFTLFAGECLNHSDPAGACSALGGFTSLHHYITPNNVARIPAPCLMCGVVLNTACIVSLLARS